MGNNEDIKNDGYDDAQFANHIVIDIDEGKTYDMEKDFKQVGKTTLFYILIQFCLSFVLMFMLVYSVMSSIISQMGPSDAMLSENALLSLVEQEFINQTVFLTSITLLISSFFSGFLAVRSGKKKLRIEKAELRRKSTWSTTLIIKYSIIAMGLSMIGSFIVMGLDMFVSFFGMQLTTPDFSLTQDVYSNILMLISVLVLAPIFEELLCRGIILRGLQRYNTRFAIIVSSIIFGLLHMNLIQGIPAFMMGIVFAYVSVKSNSILPSIVMHFINNAFSVIATAFISISPIADVAFLVIQLLMMLFAVYYIISHRTQFTQDEDLMISAKGYYSRFFNSWPNVVLITICTIFTLFSFIAL